MAQRQSRANAALVLLLALLSLLIPATGCSTAPGVVASAGATASPWQLPEETHHVVKETSVTGDRIRREVPPGPSHIPAALTFAVLLAVSVLCVRPVRGPVRKRGPDSPGRHRLVEIGIDRQ